PPTLKKDHFPSPSEIIRESPKESRTRESSGALTIPDASPSAQLPVPEVVIATQIGAQLGQKAKAVLAYLNSIRSLESQSYTVPVGYSQISSAAQVDSDYLRRKVLPKLAMIGLLAVARKSLSGTIYHLPYPAEYLHAVAEVGEESLQAFTNIPLKKSV